MSHVPHDHSQALRGYRAVVAAIAALLVGYGVALVAGWPQAATARIVAERGHQADHAATGGDQQHTATPPPLWTVAPFAALLGAIAVLPLIPALAHWWEHNRNRFLVAASMAAATLTYYLWWHVGAVERHFVSHAVVPAAGSGTSWQMGRTVLENALLVEFVPFIVLLFSLYTIAGGIRIDGDLLAHPLVNVAFLAVGGLLASFIGTTGAAMLLIRPLLDTNRERKQVAHTVVFFIFVVCNCGGLLTPLGDPPLFLGYLEGVDFLWTLRLWPSWLFVNGALLAVYLAWDWLFAYPREAVRDRQRDERLAGQLRVHGLALQGSLLVLLILSVALFDPSKAVPGTSWHAWLYLREATQLGLVAVSLAAGSLALRVANRFTFDAIIEVAALFFGIFICMQPALAILAVRGGELGLSTPRQFFWVTGSLSAVLDNAPTYLVFFQTAQALPASGQALVAGVAEPLLAAISLGAVFMGAMTYIGNGPNFMVKAIAESSDVPMPSFFGYLLHSVLVLLPILLVNAWLFL
jgi:Na+/H+ antiporter NhaD/arsenite permease-like protein